MKLTTTLVLFLLVLIGIAFAQTRPPQSPQSSAATPNNGRYQIVMSPLAARNTVLLDTQTGKTWQLTSFSDLEDGSEAWLFQSRIDNDQELAAFARAHRKP